jgi:uncharacterized protein YukE
MMAQWEVGGNVGRIGDLQSAQSTAHAAFQSILDDAHQLAMQTRAGWGGAGEAEFGQVESQFQQHSHGVQAAFQRLITSTGECAANWANACGRLRSIW